MKVKTRVMVGNAPAVLFENGDVAYAGQIFPRGMGCNASVLRALSLI